MSVVHNNPYETVLVCKGGSSPVGCECLRVIWILSFIVFSGVFQVRGLVIFMFSVNVLASQQHTHAGVTRKNIKYTKGVFGTVRTEVYRRYFRRYIPYRAFRYARYRLPYHTENFGTLGTALHTLPKISVFEEKIPRVR